MFRWYVIALAALALLLLVAGLLALILPEEYEGSEIYNIDEMHTIRMLDVVGAALLAAGCTAAWLAGLSWQRRIHGS
ncbi:MAG: hypothetical protein PVG25_05430 [Anaerolineae bacterium]|jgi:alkylation response protein AidB-like acyl-CoA dehydrogenase